MKIRSTHPFASCVLAWIAFFLSSVTNSQEPNISADEALKILQADEGTWDVAVTFWMRPGTEPIKSHAVVTAKMELRGKYLMQQFDGTLGPELGNQAWTSVSYTNYNASTGQFEAVRMASSGSPMIVVRGKATPDGKNGASMELSGEYMMAGAGSEATERDVIRHEGPDKCVIESYMSFAGIEEYKGAEFVLTRAKPKTDPETNLTKKEHPMQLGNFSVSLAVKDLAVSKAFYEKLGFQSVAGDGKGYLIMQNETATIGLFQGMFDKNILTFNPGWDRTTATLPEFEDVREIQRALKKHGIELSTTADESTDGPASLTFSDPDGNMILLDQHAPDPKKK